MPLKTPTGRRPVVGLSLLFPRAVCPVHAEPVQARLGLAAMSAFFQMAERRSQREAESKLGHSLQCLLRCFLDRLIRREIPARTLKGIVVTPSWAGCCLHRLTPKRDALSGRMSMPHPAIPQELRCDVSPVLATRRRELKRVLDALQGVARSRLSASDIREAEEIRRVVCDPGCPISCAQCLTMRHVITALDCPEDSAVLTVDRTMVRVGEAFGRSVILAHRQHN